MNEHSIETIPSNTASAGHNEPAAPEDIPPMEVATDAFDRTDPENERIMLNEHQRALLEHQWKLFWKLKRCNREQASALAEASHINSSDLVHMTDMEQLEGILQTGVLASELRGQVDDGETFYCADFWRAGQEGDLHDFIAGLREEDTEQRKNGKRMMNNPLGRTAVGKWDTIALVFDTSHPDLQELLALSVNGTDRENPLRTSFPQVRFPGESKEGTTGHPMHDAVLGGIPSEYIKALIVGPKIEQNPEQIASIKQQLAESGLKAAVFGSTGDQL